MSRLLNEDSGLQLLESGGGLLLEQSPFAITGIAGSIGKTFARITDNSSSGGQNVTERGIVVSTSISPTTSNTKYVYPGTSGSFDVKILNLTEATQYYVRAYIIDDSGTTYGDNLSFITATIIPDKHYFYRVYDGADFIEIWSDDVISLPSFRSNINSGPGQLVIKLGRPFDDFGEDIDVKLNNRVECYVVDNSQTNGLLIYSGYISGYKPVLQGDTQFVEVTCFNYSSELQRLLFRDSGGATTVTYSSYDPAAIMRDVIDKLQLLGSSLTYTSSSIQDTNTIASYTFNTNTGKEVFDKIIELCPVGWYWRIDPDNVVYLQPKNVFADHIFTIGLNIENLETYRRIEDLVNTVYFTGSGDPALFYKYENTGSQDAYGRYERKIVDQRVSLAATASLISNRLIDSQKDPEIRSRFTIVDDNGPSYDMGYDIESIKVGQTLKVLNLKTDTRTPTPWDVSTWDSDVWDQTISSQAADVVQILSLDYRPDSIVIEASSRLPQIAKRIEDINRNLENSQTVTNPSTAS